MKDFKVTVKGEVAEPKCKFCRQYPADYGRGFCSDTCELEAEVWAKEDAELASLAEWHYYNG